MKNEELNKQIEKLIREGEHQKAFELAHRITDIYSKGRISIISGRYMKLHKEWLSGLLTDQEFRVEESKLAYKLLQILSSKNEKNVFRRRVQLATIVLLISSVLSLTWYYISISKKAPFEVDYVLLRGNAISYFLQNEVATNWDELFSPGTQISNNEVLDRIQFMNRNFYYEFDQDMVAYLDQSRIRTSSYQEDVSQDIPADYEKFMSSLVQNTYLQGTESEDWSYDNNITRPINKQGELLDIINEIQAKPTAWKLLLFGTSDTNSFEEDIVRLDPTESKFFTFSNRQMVKSFLPDFYKYISKDRLPENFIPTFFSVTGEGCGIDHIGFQLDFLTPLMQLLVVSIENTSERSIEVGDFFLTMNSDQGLRSYSDDRKKHNSLASQVKRYFPKGKSLKPGERLIIPLEISFYHQPKDIEILAEIDSLGQIDHTQKLKSQNNQTELDVIIESIYYDSPPIDTFRLKGEVLNNLMANKESFVHSLSSSCGYVFGESIQINQVEVDKRIFDFRRFDPDILVMQNGWPRGSCPYVFTFDPLYKDWLIEDHILYGLNSPAKEKFDTIKLMRFDGKLQIRELDPETSYIDFLKVVSYVDNETPTPYWPAHDSLLQCDEKYLILNQGDQIEIQFTNIEDLPKGDFYLISRGYYIPYAFQ